MRSRLAAFSVLVALVLGSASAHGDGLSSAERDRLMHGETVARAQQIEQGFRRYVGGVTYTIVDSGADAITTLLGDATSWRRILPKTRDAHRVGAVAGDQLVEVTHGSALVKVAYTMRVHRDGRVLRFWMDPTREHDIEDAWGFFRAEPLADGRTLVTYGILIDMGDGILRDLFEDRVRELSLTVGDRVRGLVLERNAVGRRASR